MPLVASGPRADSPVPSDRQSARGVSAAATMEGSRKMRALQISTKGGTRSPPVLSGGGATTRTVRPASSGCQARANSRPSRGKSHSGPAASRFACPGTPSCAERKSSGRNRLAAGPGWAVRAKSPSRSDGRIAPTFNRSATASSLRGLRAASNPRALGLRMRTISSSPARTASFRARAGLMNAMPPRCQRASSSSSSSGGGITTPPRFGGSRAGPRRLASGDNEPQWARRGQD